MKARSKALAIGCATALASILSPATATATGVCYAFTHFNNETVSTAMGPPIVLRYRPTNVGGLTTDAEARNFGHLKQVAYSLVGKSTVLFDDRCATNGPQDCPSVTDDLPQIRLMTTIDGAIITGSVLPGTYPADAPGAHMGINMHLLRYVPGISQLAIGPVTLECTSPQSSPTPNYWLCSVRVEFDVGYFPFFQQFAINSPIRLDKLPPNTAEACSVFQDGRLVVTAPDA